MGNSLPNHDCKNFLKKVFLVLDGELDSEEKQSFIQDIERCQYCLEHFRIEKEFKEFVIRKVERRNCSDSLKTAIIQQIKIIEEAGD